MSIKAGNGSVGGNYLSQTYLSGSIILSQSYTESFSDGISAIDSITRNPFKVFADNIGLTDLIRRLTGKNVFSDNIGASDNISFTKVLILILTDTINMVDDFFTDYFQFFSRLFIDGVGIADSWSRKLDKLLSFSDEVTLSEVVKKGLNRILADIISTIDNIHFTQHFLKTFTDTISAIDNIGKKTITAFSDGIGLVDSKILTPIKVFVESISLSENIIKSVKIVLSSTVHIRDSIVRRLNGMLISWEKTAMDITDWTKRARQVIGTTKIARALTDWTKTNKKEDTFSKTARNEEEWTKLKGEK
jgi:hypothetical protein